jgi:hypothetical protein
MSEQAISIFQARKEETVSQAREVVNHRAWLSFWGTEGPRAGLEETLRVPGAQRGRNTKTSFQGSQTLLPAGARQRTELREGGRNKTMGTGWAHGELKGT